MIQKIKKTSQMQIIRPVVRTMAGSGLVETACALTLLAMGVVVAVPLLLNTGAATYYNEKMTFIANQTATFAANDLETTQPSDAKQFAFNLLKSMNMSNSDLSVELASTTIGNTGAPGIQATITASQPTLLLGSASNFLPSTMKLTAVGIASAVPYAPEWLVGQDPIQGSVLVNMVNANGAIPSNLVPSASPPPVYSMSLNGPLLQNQ